MRVVADTNVIVSGLVFGGVPRQVLELTETGLCDLFYSEAIQAEVERILADKFGWDASRLRQVLVVLWSMGKVVVPCVPVCAVADDPDDDRILECALAANAAYIVSGDRHLLRMRSYKSVLIVSPREFIEALAGE